MKKPILGNQSFLSDNNKRVESYENYIKEVYDRPLDEKPLYTGRYFMVLKDGQKSFAKTKKMLESKMGFSVANSSDFVSESLNESNMEGADALIYEDLGVALVGGEDEQIQMLESADANADFILEPEKIVYVPDDAPGVLNIPSTWGIDITQAINSQYNGQGIKLAVLDTGFDVEHPDYNGRNITTNSFVPNETIRDVHGHGTHCIGSACGNIDSNGQRYGVATNAWIYAGKVLSNQGSGAQSWVLNGMMWAAKSGCKVISLSLGSRVFPGQSYDMAYERAAQFAISQGAVVIAAAGNDSRRSWNQFNPVSSPADSASILSVGALDSNLNIADFSNRSINPTGEVDIAGPGVLIYSSWPMPMRYRTISGTSMATPHVAGIIALLWEQNPNTTPDQIIEKLKNLAKQLPLLGIDIGVGLSIAP
jgi:subtilisin family serine protease